MTTKVTTKARLETGPNMTPLVDIVMVILIFLMLTGTFATAEHFLVSKGAVGKIGGPEVILPTPLKETKLEIRVDSFSRPGPDGQPQEMWAAQAGGFMVQNSRQDLVRQLKAMRDNFARNNTPVEDVQVVINPSRITKYKHMVQAYEAALDAKFVKVAFSTAH